MVIKTVINRSYSAWKSIYNFTLHFAFWITRKICVLAPERPWMGCPYKQRLPWSSVFNYVINSVMCTKKYRVQKSSKIIKSTSLKRKNNKTVNSTENDTDLLNISLLPCSVPILDDITPIHLTRINQLETEISSMKNTINPVSYTHLTLPTM
jgi:hypothetical protein